MKKSAGLFPIALALGAIMLTPSAIAQAQDGRQEGRIQIEKCQTISQPGSYKLVNNLTLGQAGGTCLSITANLATIDLAGFTISGPTSAMTYQPGPTASRRARIFRQPVTAVHNGCGRNLHPLGYRGA
jgi:hypothetical protein